VGKIEGADVSKLLNSPQTSSTKKRWTVGPYIGFGIAFGKNVYQIGPGVGVSLQYALIRF
jgi:hypothetical protein